MTGQHDRVRVKGIHRGCLSLLHDDFGDHPGVNRAVVDVRAGFGKRIREAIIGIERFGLEYVGIAGNHMRSVIFVCPSDCSSGSDRDVRAEAEVIDFDFGP